MRKLGEIFSLTCIKSQVQSNEGNSAGNAQSDSLEQQQWSP